MSLTLPPETIESFLQAARARFTEGTLLLNAGHTSGAIYLFGYVGEAVLKAVAFRNLGLGPLDPIHTVHRQIIEGWMKEAALAPKSGHDIVKWAKWIVAK